MQLNNPHLPENKLAGDIIAAAFEVHQILGPGLLESAYAIALFTELVERKLEVAKEVYLPVRFKGADLGINYRIDLLVNQTVIVEIKAVEQLAPIHYSQLLTYLKLSETRLGLLINFNSELLKNGIRRVVNGLY